MAKPSGSRDKVFLNIPYDEKFEKLFLAYIAGISALGLVPRATLEIPESTRRLEDFKAGTELQIFSARLVTRGAESEEHVRLSLGVRCILEPGNFLDRIL